VAGLSLLLWTKKTAGCRPGVDRPGRDRAGPVRRPVAQSARSWSPGGVYTVLIAIAADGGARSAAAPRRGGGGRVMCAAFRWADFAT